MLVQCSEKATNLVLSTVLFIVHNPFPITGHLGLPLYAVSSRKILN